MSASKSINREVASSWLGVESGNFDHFKTLVDRNTNPVDWQLAAEIVQNIPVYDGRFVNQCAHDPDQSRALLGEWCVALGQGPGIIAVKAAFADTGIIDQASEVFSEIIRQQHNNADGVGDHFAAGGANDRIWNSLEKHCLSHPENFAKYFACPYPVACQYRLARTGISDDRSGQSGSTWRQGAGCPP